MCVGGVLASHLQPSMKVFQDIFAETSAWWRQQTALECGVSSESHILKDSQTHWSMAREAKADRGGS